MNLNNVSYSDSLSYSNKLRRLLWQALWKLTGTLLPYRTLNSVKIALLRLFGADIHRTSVVYSSVEIFDPRNLVLGANATLGARTIIYNVNLISIGEGTVISQYAHLCTATHDYNSDSFDLKTGPITIGNNCWIATDVFIAMNVEITNNVVIGARTSIFKSILIEGVYANKMRISNFRS